LGGEDFRLTQRWQVGEIAPGGKLPKGLVDERQRLIAGMVHALHHSERLPVSEAGFRKVTRLQAGTLQLRLQDFGASLQGGALSNLRMVEQRPSEDIQKPTKYG